MLAIWWLCCVSVWCTFVVRDGQYGVVRYKELSNTETNERVTVITNFGGDVDELWLASPITGVVRQVLWSHDRNSTQVVHNPTWKGRMLIPYGNRIGNATYVFNNTRFYLPVNDVAGLNNSLHGLLWNKSMEVVHMDHTADLATVTLRHDFGNDPGYPFRLRCDIRYTLTRRGFEAQVSATNMDPWGWPLPFYNGWHPYFLTSDVSRSFIILDKCADWRYVDVGQGPQYPPPRHSNMVPTTHTRPWNSWNGTDPIGGTKEVPTYIDAEVKATQRCDLYSTKLVDPVAGRTAVLWHDGRYLQVFTGAKKTWNVSAVVLEPLSAMSDAYNNHDGLHVLSSGETYFSNFGIYLER